MALSNLAGSCTSLRAAQILVVGAGPAGLAAAKELLELGARVAVIDKSGLPGGAYRRMYPKLFLSSPSRFLQLPGFRLAAGDEYISAVEFASYLARYAEHYGIPILKQELTSLYSISNGVKVNFSDCSSATFSAVVIATGMTDHPIWPDIPGLTKNAAEPICLHSQDWPGPSPFLGRRIVIVGARSRAVEIAEECAQSGLNPIVTARHRRLTLWPLRILGWDTRYIGYPILHSLPIGLFRRRCSLGWRFHGTNRTFRRFVAMQKIRVVDEIRSIEGRRVCLIDNSSTEADVIVFATGYRFEMSFLPSFVKRSSQGYPLVEHGEYPALSNVFFIGIPCSRRLDSQFIHGMASEAPLLAAAAVKVRR